MFVPEPRTPTTSPHPHRLSELRERAPIIRRGEVDSGEFGVSEVDSGADEGFGGEPRVTQAGVGEVYLTEVDGGVMVAIGLELSVRATHVGEGEVGLLEIDDGVASVGICLECRATEVGVGEVGVSEVDGGLAVVVVRTNSGSKFRASQVCAGEVSPSEVDEAVDSVPFADVARGSKLRATQVPRWSGWLHGSRWSELAAASH